MSGGSIPSFDSTTYRAPHKFHSRIGTQSTVLRKRSPNVEAEREAERGVALSPRPKTWRQDSVQCVKARNDVACQRIDFGIAHDAIGKLGIATVSGVELGADALARRPKLGVQVKRRLDNAAARIRLTFRGEPFAIGGSHGVRGNAAVRLAGRAAGKHGAGSSRIGCPRGVTDVVSSSDADPCRRPC